MTEQPQPPRQTGRLQLVATPIGNLEDITLRAIRSLKECDIIAAEDTRHSGILLKHFEIKKRMVSYHQHNEARRSQELVEQMLSGEIVALISDAGSPGISDPGARIVKAAIEAGIPVEAIPGPCALVAGLTTSGLNSEEFHFLGFLPVKSGQREKRLTEALRCPGTLVIYESPHRIVKLLNQLIEIAPARQVVITREITKKFEETLRGQPADILGQLGERRPKGEFVVLIEQGDLSQRQEQGPEKGAQSAPDSTYREKKKAMRGPNR